jgi:glycosyltransferase involved in cell wall biosynthesis
MKIWLPALRVGSGTDVFVQRLAQGLLNAGHEPVVEWFPHRFELTPWKLKRFPAPAGTDLIHAGSWQGFAFKRAGIPLVITEHQYIDHPAFAPYRSVQQMLYHRVFIRKCVRRSYEVADAIVAVSNFCAEAMRADLTKPVTVIHNWVDTEIFSPLDAVNEQVPTPHLLEHPFKLLFVGNPSRWKGADLIPTIAAQLGPDFEIQCLGGLRSGFDAKHLSTNVKLLPQVVPLGMPEVYRSVDAVLVPTRYEAFGYVALEAMACGVPVVGFDSSGTAEVCLREQTALLAPMEDVDQLITNIQTLAQHPTLCGRLGTAGRQRALQYFGQSGAVNAYLDVYDRCLSSFSGW